MDSKVQHDEASHKFFIQVDGKQATLEYQEGPGRWDFLHTYVPPEARGQGVADVLVQHALDEARRRGLQFVPSCPFVRGFVERHPQYQDGLARV
ncbi:MAG TPA: GNAT family N-acetyltransferase [Thermoanaerobaculia bacterium]|nr:GNAT family N-acetyltransferase [Thermoanaerobaculia bacterium]